MESPQPAYPSRNPATFPLEELGHWPIVAMNFEWDDAKSEECFRTRGVDFASMIPAFTDPNRLVEIDDRRDYGET